MLILNTIRTMLEFGFTFGLIKVLKATVIATPVMLLSLLVCKVNSRRNPLMNLGLLLLLPVCSFTGCSRLFFRYPFIWVTMWIGNQVTTFWGWIYGGVTGLLLLCYILSWGRLQRRVNKLELFSQNRKSRISIRVTRERVGPYSTGIFRPVIVLPECMVQQCEPRELEVILHHERTHIKSGHIVLLQIFALLKILWWFHPLVYVCDRALRAQLEYVCDGACVNAMPVTRHEYGTLMLKVAQCVSPITVQSETRSDGVVHFTGRQYILLKQRLIRLRESRMIECLGAKKQHRFALLMGVLVCGLLVGVKFSSYPRYTEIREIGIYDAEMDVITNDAAGEGVEVVIDGRNIQIDKESFQIFCRKHNITGEYVYLSFGGIYKVPGIGGGGEVVQVCCDNPKEFTYITADTWINKVQMFVLKYLF